MRYIAHFNPLQNIVNFQNAFERAFDMDWSQPSANGNSPRSRLPLDVFEQEEAYTIIASLPGIAAENIGINLEKDILTIQAELPSYEAGEDAKALWRERRHGKFARSIKLPIPIQHDSVTAEYENGVLRLTLPKAESARTQQIPVRALTGA